MASNSQTAWAQYNNPAPTSGQYPSPPLPPETPSNSGNVWSSILNAIPNIIGAFTNNTNTPGTTPGTVPAPTPAPSQSNQLLNLGILAIFGVAVYFIIKKYW